jgi:glycosyltransferase involved in cell wall biosynthesis
MVNVHIIMNSCSHGTRVFRESAFLVRSGLFSHVRIVALWDPGLEEEQRLDDQRIITRLRLRTRKLPRLLPFQLIKLVEWFFRALSFTLRLEPKVVTVHHFNALPVAVLIKWLARCRIVYAPHELETEVTFPSRTRKWLSKLLERSCIDQCDEIIVVNRSIANWYQKRYGLDSVHVVKNVPDFAPRKPEEPRFSFRKTFAIPDDSLVFLYQGALLPERGIELALEVFSKSPKAKHMVFMGDGQLVETIIDHQDRCAHIHFLPKVPSDQILFHTAGADVGISPIQRTCLNNYYSLPNKVYEYLYSGLPIIVSDFPELRDLVITNEVGWAIDMTPENLLQLIEEITPASVDALRENVAEFQKKPLWEHETVSLESAYGNALKALQRTASPKRQY